MAWIESHQSLLTHRKTMRAIGALKVDRYKFIGHLHALWWWALDNADDGNLSGLNDTEIAAAAGWHKGRATEFVTALSEAGFIDAGTRQLHDWEDYAGKLIDRRRRNAERKRQARAVEREDVHRTDAGRTQHVPRMSGATQPDPTRPNQTQQNPTLPPPPTPSSAAGGGLVDSDFGRICQLYEENIGKLTVNAKGRLEELSYDYSALWFEGAVKEAVTHNARNLAYVEAVLKRWGEEGFQSGVPPGNKSKAKGYQIGDLERFRQRQLQR